MSAIWAIAVKDLRLLSRDRAGLFFVVGFPFLYSIFLGFVFAGVGGRTRPMSVALVDEDRSAKSAAFAAALAESKSLEVTTHEAAEARELVRLGKRVAYVVLPKGFGERGGMPFVTQPPEVELGVDPARQAEAAILRGVLTQQAFLELKKNFGGRTKPDAGAAGAAEAENSAQVAEWVPIKIASNDVAPERKGPRSGFEITFPQGMVWGILFCAASFGGTLVTERRRGTLLRACMAPVGRSGILGGKALASLLSIACVAGSLTAFSAAALGVRMSYPVNLFLAIVCSALSFVGIVVLLSVLGKTEASASGITMAALLMMSMTGGGMVPLFAMPEWMLKLGNFSPVKWSILAIEAGIWRGFTPLEMLKPCGILLGVGAACFFLGARLLKWNPD